MTTGTVEWFSATKHYGFIAPDGGEPDVFVHTSALTAASRSAPQEGARVSFDLEQAQGRSSAANLIMPGAQSNG